MALGAVIKRTFQIAACLAVLGVIGLGALSGYVENNPKVQQRLKVSAIDAEYRVDKDASFWTKAGALVAAWWRSDELLAEAERDKALEADAAVQNRKAEAQRRFNDHGYRDDDDYYASTGR